MQDLLQNVSNVILVGVEKDKIFMRNRSNTLDVLKGFAIIAVILYHAGLMTYGYLGVEEFLVIAGFLTTKGIIKQYDTAGFGYFTFLQKRLLRLWPLALLISLVSLTVGYFVMLPDNYKICSETVVGTSWFANNFIQYITSGNYWDTSNDYKPLMHTWYLGIMMQYYLLIPLLIMAVHKFSGGTWQKNVRTMLYVVTALSLALYLLPFVPDANRFYLLPARLWEFSVGGLLAVPVANEDDGKTKKYGNVALLAVALLMFVNSNMEIAQIRLVLTVLITVFLVYLATRKSATQYDLNIRVVAYCGAASYSLYLWHQVILAFYRYVISSDLSVIDYAIIIVASFVVGIASYKFLEQPLAKIASKRAKFVMLFSCFVVASMLTFAGGFIYKHHGIVRDIPELDIVNSYPYAETQDYNERNMAYDKDFADNGRKNVLVIGNSYGRDWINVLRESGVDSIMNISYHQTADDVVRNRICKADVVFVATNQPFDEFYPLVPAMMQKKFYCVGYKSFGRCVGNYYNHSSKGYYSQTFSFDNSKNVEWLKVFGKDHLIDMMSTIQNADGTYSVFTPENKMFSHDGIHLTQSGAREFANKLNITQYFSIK